MARVVQLYVEGKSDKTFFEGTKFKEFVSSNGFATRVKNLRTKGNVLSNFEKFLKLQPKDVFASVLVSDKDCRDFDSRRVEAILKSYANSRHHVAIQEIEAWFMADHKQVKAIHHDVKPMPDTQSETDPKRWLKKLFLDGGKGFKNEIGFAEHFAERIDLMEARKHNKSLHRFLELFENKFKAA